MATNFQFFFCGPQHSYLTSVTNIIGKAQPDGPSAIEAYGLPTEFVNKFQEESSKKYIYKVRGHDFLSHFGVWTNEKTESGYVEPALQSVGEIERLRKFVDEHLAIPRRADPITVTFGPGRGSFFADSQRLRRYRWANLPEDLESKIQNLVCEMGYGSKDGNGQIHDLAMNASGGWVIQFKDGKEYEWGDDLPDTLKQALERGKNRKAQIAHLFLNHQNADEYVLLFKDGSAYFSLHPDFEMPLKRLLNIWAKNRRATLEWNYFPSCRHPVNVQSERNAAYYNSRGLFQLSRGKSELALAYLREAHHQHPTSESYERNFAMALIAVQDDLQDETIANFMNSRANPQSQRMFINKRDRHEGFRLEFVHMFGLIEKFDGLQNLRDQLGHIMKTGLDGNGRRAQEWSYKTVVEEGELLAPHEMDSQREPSALPKGLIELQGSDVFGKVQSSELSVDRPLSPVQTTRRESKRSVFHIGRFGRRMVDEQGSQK